MLETYSEIIKQYHKALSRSDITTLKKILTKDAALDIENTLLKINESGTLLTGEINIIGLEIEGNGKFIQVHYIFTTNNNEFNLLLELKLGGIGDIKINQSLPSWLTRSGKKPYITQ